SSQRPTSMRHVARLVACGALGLVVLVAGSLFSRMGCGTSLRYRRENAATSYPQGDLFGDGRSFVASCHFRPDVSRNDHEGLDLLVEWRARHFWFAALRDPRLRNGRRPTDHARGEVDAVGGRIRDVDRAGDEAGGSPG